MVDLILAYEEELGRLRDEAVNWQGVARNMAQVLNNTLDRVRDGQLTFEDIPALRAVFRDQCEAHHVTP